MNLPGLTCFLKKDVLKLIIMRNNKNHGKHSTVKLLYVLSCLLFLFKYKLFFHCQDQIFGMKFYCRMPYTISQQETHDFVTLLYWLKFLSKSPVFTCFNFMLKHYQFKLVKYQAFLESFCLRFDKNKMIKKDFGFWSHS